MTFHVGVSDRRVSLVPGGRHWPGTTSVCESIDFAPAEQGETWQPAVLALAQWLAGQAGKKLSLHLVLSGRYVRWQLLPWRPELTQAQEVAAYARARFKETFGKVADDWQVLHTPQPPGKTTLACAVDTALLQALQTTCETAGAKLASVTPYFASAFDHWRASLTEKTLWFGLIESDGLSLGLLQDGHWIAQRTQRLDDDWRALLPGMLAQLAIVANLADTQVPVYLAGEVAVPAPVAGLAFNWLQPKGAGDLAHNGYRLAMGV
jgi:hypothetical protein